MYRISNCCGADIVPETDVCSECGEHCKVEEIIDCDTEQIDFDSTKDFWSPNFQPTEVIHYKNY